MTKQKTISEEWKIDDLAEQLHRWYLEATYELDPEDFNPKAVCEYSDLREGQKFIDKFIAEKLISLILQKQKEAIEGVLPDGILKKGYSDCI